MELLDVEQVAAMLRVGQRTVWRFRDAARMPGAVTLGKCVRWRKADIESWIEHGCPDVRRTGWTRPAGCGGKGGCHA